MKIKYLQSVESYDTFIQPVCSTHKYYQTLDQQPSCSFLIRWKYFFSTKKSWFFSPHKTRRRLFFYSGASCFPILFQRAVVDSFVLWVSYELFKRYLTILDGCDDQLGPELQHLQNIWFWKNNDSTTHQANWPKKLEIIISWC